MRSVEAKETRAPAAGAADERALMARVSAGDAAAFNRIVGLHMAMVHGLAWRMLGDSAEAEDVVQDCFVKLWVNAKGWAPSGGGLGAWLRRVATNACLDRLRKPKGASDEVLAEHADDGPPADAMIDEARRGEAVAGAIRSLPERQRAAIVLTYYEGASNAEAAAILGLGVKALESLLVRARQALSRSLASHGLLDGGAA